MLDIRILSRGQCIRTLDDWHEHARPKRDYQWKEGRSAMECAKAWLRGDIPAVPVEFLQLFASHPATANLQIHTVFPEKVTRLDDFRGEHRNHDLVLIGEIDGVKAVIGVEAKADESFGNDIVEAYLQRAAEKSKVPDRIRLLTDALFGCQPIEKGIGKLQYQLLTAVGGTLTEAREQCAGLAIFIVHEFHMVTDPVKVAVNTRALDEFVRKLTGDQCSTIQSGQLIGPIMTPGHGTMPLYMGKIVTSKEVI